MSRIQQKNIRFHLSRSKVENGLSNFTSLSIRVTTTDISLKLLAEKRIDFLINKLGMRSFTLETLKQLADEVDE
ncbi:hypothetical protein Tco_1256335 [Tanacetum coccineum]